MLSLNPKLHLIAINSIVILLLLVPLIIPKAIINQFEVGPMLGFYLVTGVLLFSTGLYFVSSKAKSYPVGFNGIDLTVLFSITVIFYNTFLLQKPGFITDNLLCYTCLTIIYYILRFNIQWLDHNYFESFAFTLIVIMSVIAFIHSTYVILQFCNIIPTNNQLFKVTGIFFNPARCANYINSILPILIAALAFFPFVLKGKIVLKVLIFLAAALCFTALVITYTRAAWIGVLAGSALIMFYKYWRVLKVIKHSFLIFGAVIAIVVIGSIFLFKLKPESALGRVTVWNISSKIAEDHFFTGVGFGKFKNIYSIYQSNFFSTHHVEESMIKNADTIRYAYNIFLEILVEQGVGGLIAFILLVYFLVPSPNVFTSNKNAYKSFILAASFCSIISIIVCGMFSYPFDILPVYIIFFVLMALISGIKGESRSLIFVKFRKLVIIPSGVFRLLGGVLILFAFTLFINSFNRLFAYKKWSLVTGTNSENLSPLYDKLKGDVDYIEDYSTILLKENKHQEAISVINNAKHIIYYPNTYSTIGQCYSKMGQPDSAERNLIFAANMVPNRLNPRYLLAQHYYENKQYNKALSLSKEILNMPVKILSITSDDILFNTKLLIIKCNEKIVQNSSVRKTSNNH